MENAIWNWKDADVHSLIKLRTKKSYIPTGKKGTAKRNWDEIAAKLACGATGHQCKKKWENLVTKYKSIIILPTGDGLEEQDHDANCWIFYDEMNEFMSDRHTIKPILMLQSATTPHAPTTTALVRSETSSASIASPHPSPTSSDYNLAFSPISASPLTSSTLPPRPSSAPASYDRPSTSETPVIVRHSASSTPLSASSIGSQSWSCSYSGEDSALEDSASVESTRNPRKRRRTQSQSNDHVIAELMAQIKAEMKESRLQQEEARKYEKYMLDILKSILDKK